MIVFRTSLALVLASTALTACINDDSDSTTIPLSGKEVVMQAAGDCTLQLDCGDGTIVRCSGSNNQCFSGPGSSTITCNGIATSCSIVTPRLGSANFEESGSRAVLCTVTAMVARRSSAPAKSTVCARLARSVAVVASRAATAMRPASTAHGSTYSARCSLPM